jgi:hypothetical protein
MGQRGGCRGSGQVGMGVWMQSGGLTRKGLSSLSLASTATTCVGVPHAQACVNAPRVCCSGDSSGQAAPGNGRHALRFCRGAPDHEATRSVTLPLKGLSPYPGKTLATCRPLYILRSAMLFGESRSAPCRQLHVKDCLQVTAVRVSPRRQDQITCSWREVTHTRSTTAVTLRWTYVTCG